MDRLKPYLILLLVVAVALATRYMVPVGAYFSDTETVRCEITAGTWQETPTVKICGICPDWGIAGACRWPTFIYGKGFEGGALASLVRGGQVLPAVKTWVLNGSTIYAVFDLRGASSGPYDVRLEFSNGTKAVLYGGFNVVDWKSCENVTTMYKNITTMEYPAGEDTMAWEKTTAGPQGAASLRIVSKNGLTRKVSEAYAVAPGLLIIGDVSYDERGRVTLTFKLDGAPPVSFDVVLLDAEDWPILLEGMITPADIRALSRTPPTNKTPVTPGTPAIPATPATPGDSEKLPADSRKKSGSEEKQAAPPEEAPPSETTAPSAQPIPSEPQAYGDSSTE